MNFQLGTALLDGCVLATLVKEDTYGYVLTQNIQKLIDISESTLYPVLRRLLKDGYLTSYDQPFQGRNRKYYQITESGKERLQSYIDAWNEYKEKVDSILIGGDHNE